MANPPRKNPDMPQYALKLMLEPVFTSGNFIVSDCNRDAFQWIQAWPDWPESASPAHALLLYGPEGAGKSHLAHIWAKKASATLQAAATLPDIPVTGNQVIEDIDRMAGERRLLHAFNLNRENGTSMLMTSSLSPKQLPFTLPDLMSRLLSIPAAHLDQPDDFVLAGAMRKQFADRQMKVDEDVIAYAVPRLERSLAKIKELVEVLDASALAERKNITIPFVRKLLDTLQNTTLL